MVPPSTPTVGLSSTLIRRDCRSSIKKAIQNLPLPSTLVTWYVSVLTIISDPSPAAKDAVRTATASKAPKTVCHILEQVLTNDDAPLSEISGVPFTKLHHTPHVENILTCARRTLGGALDKGACNCPLHLSQHPTLKNSLGHLVLRTDPEWRTLFPDKEGLLITGNARNRVWHSTETFGEAFEGFLTSIDEATIPIPSLDGEDPFIPIFDARAPSLDRIQLKANIARTFEVGRGISFSPPSQWKTRGKGCPPLALRGAYGTKKPHACMACALPYETLGSSNAP